MTSDRDRERAKEIAERVRAMWTDRDPVALAAELGLAAGRAEVEPRLCCADCGATVPGPPYPSGHWHDCPTPGRYLSQTAGPIPLPQEPPR